MAEATERFAELVHRPEDEIALDEAALLIAAHNYPMLDVDSELRRLDDLAAGVRDRTMQGLIEELFGRRQFAGNHDDYGDPRNSFLNDVLDRRLGIPITLSVVTMEVGRRLGLRLAGVGMPGHFLVRGVVDGEDMWIDSFNHGRLLSQAACVDFFLERGGRFDEFDVSLLEPVGPRLILIRMLTNLRHTYVTSGDGPSLAWVGRLRATIPGLPITDQAEQARFLMNLARFEEAAEVLERIAAEVDDTEGVRLRKEANLLRARLN